MRSSTARWTAPIRRFRWPSERMPPASVSSLLKAERANMRIRQRQLGASAMQAPRVFLGPVPVHGCSQGADAPSAGAAVSPRLRCPRRPLRLLRAAKRARSHVASPVRRPTEGTSPGAFTYSVQPNQGLPPRWNQSSGAPRRHDGVLGPQPQNSGHAGHWLTMKFFSPRSKKPTIWRAAARPALTLASSV